ncbi:3-demethylubiquinone-9 3-O-methyltransferase [Roseibium denhamense]|uniref:3-demethylubiquinone-9 3-methyltransferase n=1 Tax=Roseibium denhamense TaxID=76305 RepID=A0ABY1PEB3_9HYPH|nr:bifunctional 2-polyprenyl-6-hydroxyphenol methylase/3-demethylubiquinol 3-O-methyltransferase UbiG [Roseibium denhamense]MTI07817.1 3-demethylubiquinone-9 3-O-methyltransferase [Roseibium denhamense]SMP31947.1 3-demethylubiquinone-9 3-methyltransferase [Roseibium denhamense]
MADTNRNDLTIYDDFAANWWTDDVRWVRTLKNLVPGRLAWFERHIEWTGKKVLDLGCAGGFISEVLTERGALVSGIDPARKAIEAARQRALGLGQDIRYSVGVGEMLPYDDDSFDAVVCVDVLEHVSDLPKVISEIRRVLKPGGLFLYDTINRNWLAKLATIRLAEDVLGLLPKGTHDPELFIKPDELNKALLSADFEPGPQTGLGPRGLTRRGDFTFGALPFKSIIYMGVARAGG